MAERDNNKNINKVSLSNGTVLMDTSGVTVAPAYLLEGYTALDKTGTLITGTMRQQTVVVSEENDSHGGKIIYINGDTINLQAKTVTPTKNVQNIGSDAGYNGLSVVTVNPIPNDYIIPAGTLSITTNGTQDVSNYAAVNVNIETASQEINLQEKTATPSETQQEIIADNAYDGLSKVTVQAISKTYIGSGIERISNSKGITINGHTVSVRGAAYYTGNVSATIPLQNKTATPNTTEQEIVADSGYSGLSKVTVSPIPSQYVIPSGTITITENGTVNVNNIAEAVVNITPKLQDRNVLPTGTQQIITPTNNAYGPLLYKTDVEFVYNQEYEWGFNLEVGKYYALITTGQNGPDGDIDIDFTFDGNSVTGVAEDGITSFTITATGLTFTSSSSMVYQDSYSLILSTDIPNNYFYGLSSVIVEPIPSTYVGTGITRRNSNALTVNGATVTAPAGYYIGAASKSVASGSAATPATTITANPSISVNASGLITATASASKSVAPTISAGYVSAGTAGTITVNGSNTQQLTTKAAATITPGTTNQEIAAGTYLTGKQTIAGDADLIAGNIKTGVNIFGVSGTFTGDATAAAADILAGETAYVNGSKITGTLQVVTYYTGSTAPSSSLGNNGDIYFMR